MKKSQDSLYNATYGIWATQIGQGTDNNADAYTLQVQNKWKTGNAWFYQVYGDFAVSPKLKLGAALAYAYADKKPSASYISKKYGTEFDATMSYKIYDNLEYMIGAAYLWTGYYLKGTTRAVKLKGNYLLTHKLTLTF